MMKQYLTTLLLSAILMPYTAFSGEFDYTAYKESTITGFHDELKNDECRDSAENESIYSAVIHKYRVTTKFTRELREISDNAKLFIEHYAKSMKWNQHIVDLYQHEFLVRDSGNDYWVPVQEQLLPYMGNELKVGQEFELFVVVLGATAGKCVFVATEFNVPPNNR